MSDLDQLPVTRKRGRPKTLDEETRRQAILASAYDAFKEVGFAKTTTADVAKCAKTSKRNIYELFTNKIELFAAVIAHHRHLLVDLPRPESENLSIEETLHKIFQLDILGDEAQIRAAMLHLLHREAVLFPELTDYLYEQRIICHRELVMDWLELENQRGRIQIDDVEVYAGLLMDVVFGALLPRSIQHAATGHELRVAHIKKRLQIILASMNVA